MFDIHAVPTPCYVVDEALLIRNLQKLKEVKDRTGCKILLAQKAFSMFCFYPLIAEYLDGATASGLYEARLGREEMGKENHVFSPAYTEEDFSELISLCDHIIFNSFSQWERFKDTALESSCSFGMRINPRCSTQEHAIYDPCSPGSRLGVSIEQFPKKLPKGIDGLHFHTLCEQNADALEVTLQAVEEAFAPFLSQVKWVNFGGGHHITRADYDTELLIRLICDFKKKYGVQVYLEPGEAIALNTGFLVSKVEDILPGEIPNAILDASAACHMPDVLEMPYRPEIISAGRVGEKPFCYRLGGPTCLAGDIIGDYSFDAPLKPGDRLVFCDMAHYSMVKNNTFNGMKLPSIAVSEKDGSLKVIRRFDYNDFKGRLS